MIHPFQCRCGTVHGELTLGAALRAVCYCRDCQAYAHVLGRPEATLDALGGTDAVAAPARDVRLTAGREALACLSLSPNGLLRWYAGCCRTPIANTPRDWNLPYVGLVHTCLRQPVALEQSFPRVQLRVNTRSARGTPPRGGTVGGTVRFAGLVLRLGGDRLTGRHRQTPFFDPQGRPVVQPTVVPREEVEAARRRGG
jgi:hypothetical protein